MTSMPASRSARATTFAPRSCPSKPGLATTTRMRPAGLATVPPEDGEGSDGRVRGDERAGSADGLAEPAARRRQPDRRAGSGSRPRPPAPPPAPAPARWPGYRPRTAVTAWRLTRAVVAAWDFSTYGGSFGEDDASVLEVAAAAAVADGLPLVTLVRSGGTRLQEGMAALVGIPRARLALKRLSDAGLAHLSVADAPTTGGVWISVTAGADLRVAVEGATVAFAGPRVVEAFTGALPPEGSHTAEAAYDAGLVDALLPGPQVAGWISQVLTALTPEPVEPPAVEAVAAPTGSGWEQVQRARARTTSGRALLGDLLT